MPSIIVPLSLVEQVRGIPTLLYGQISPVYPKEGTSLVKLTYLSQSYSMVLRLLSNVGIPFDYLESKGTTSWHYRFTDEGIPWEKRIQKEEEDIPLSYLIPLADKPKELAAFVKNHQQAIDIPSWANQELYRKKYLLKQLITPKG